MLNYLLSLIAPHPCSSCGRIESILCDNCKYNISYDNFTSCLGCGKTSGQNGLCSRCSFAFSRAWCVAERTDSIKNVLNKYKFEYAKAAYRPLAWLISEKIGRLPSSVVIVPIPTIAPHIRMRGYDHSLLLAKEVARLQSVVVQTLVKRSVNNQQRGASKRQRQLQAKAAFVVDRKLKGGTYLLIDDIVTTGATLHFAAEALLTAGADEIWVAVVARQPYKNNET